MGDKHGNQRHNGGGKHVYPVVQPCNHAGKAYQERKRPQYEPSLRSARNATEAKTPPISIWSDGKALSTSCQTSGSNPSTANG